MSEQIAMIESQEQLMEELIASGAAAPSNKTDTGSQGFAQKALALVASIASEANHHAIGAADQVSRSSAPQAAAVAANPQSSSSGSYPMPNFPSSDPSNAPVNGLPTSMPSNAPAYSYNQEGYMDELHAWVAYLQNHPNNLQAKLEFLQFLGSGSSIPGASQQVQDYLDSSGVSGEIQGWIEAGALQAMFSGYGSQTGEAAAQQYLSDLQSFFGSNMPASIQSAIGTLEDDLPALANNYGFANGGTGSVTIGGVTYQWSDSSDQFIIQTYLGNFGTNGTPDPWYQQSLNASEKQYRINAVNALIAEYPNDPSIVLCLLMMEMNDSYTQDQMGGLADTTNTLNNMTNQYATPLLELAQDIGPNMTPQQAQQFTELFYNGTTMMNIQSQTSSLASTWDSNVYSTISGQSVTFTDSAGQQVTTTLGAVMSSAMSGQPNSTYNWNDVTTALRSLNPSPTSPTAPSTNGGYQSVISALQGGGAAITNTSQTIATQLGTLSQYDNQYIKFGSAVASPTGGGFMQMLLQIVNNQKSA